MDVHVCVACLRTPAPSLADARHVEIDDGEELQGDPGTWIARVGAAREVSEAIIVPPRGLG